MKSSISLLLTVNLPSIVFAVTSGILAYEGNALWRWFLLLAVICAVLISGYFWPLMEFNDKGKKNEKV